MLRGNGSQSARDLLIIVKYSPDEYGKSRVNGVGSGGGGGYTIALKTIVIFQPLDTL